jgi:hypothetical protein
MQVLISRIVDGESLLVELAGPDVFTKNNCLMVAM